MGRRGRMLLAVALFLVAWCGSYALLSLPAVLLDAWSGLGLQYRRGPVNLFTLTLALAAIPAAIAAWWLARRLARQVGGGGTQPPAPRD